MSDLPPPVSRYLRFALGDAQRIIAQADLRQSEVSAIYTPGRWSRAGKGYRLLPWEGHFGDYREHSGMRIPFYGEVGWYVQDKLELVWKGRVENASYAFADATRS